jgi:ribonuclease T2
MRVLAVLICSLFIARAALAGGEASGQFDYYVLSLSWAPNWCALTGDARGDPECDKRGLTFTLHGLWPQYDGGGYPSDCHTTARDPSRQATAAMEDIMGSDGLAWHEWKTHGRCSGLSAEAYLAAMRKARAAVRVPDLFARVGQDLQVSPGVIEDAFLESNPGLAPDQIAITCASGLIAEVRVCLTRDLRPRACGPDVLRACTAPAAGLDAVR